MENKDMNTNQPPVKPHGPGCLITVAVVFAIGLFGLSTGIGLSIVVNIVIGVVFLLVAGLGVWEFLAQKKVVNESREKARLQAIEQRKQFEKEHPHWADEQFYQACVENGIKDISSKSTVERMVLFAKTRGIVATQEELIRKFNLGKSETKRFEKKQRIAKLQAKEEALERENRKYENLFGRAKYVFVFSQKIREYEEIIRRTYEDEEAVRRGGNAFYEMGRQKEHSAAIHGGIASGIAGGAAGVATAMRIEAENAQIRAENQAHAKRAAEFMVHAWDHIWARRREAEKELEEYQNRLERLPTVLIDDSMGNELFSHLKFTVRKQVTTETGARRINIKVDTQRFKIFDDVDAVVDGTIKVLLMNGEEIVGETLFCLSETGLYREKTLEVIFREVKDCEGDITPRFEPGRLWAVETGLY